MTNPNRHHETYNLETLINEYKEADLQPRKRNEEEHLLLNHHHVAWNFLFPLGMIVLAIMMFMVGDWS